MLPQKMQTAFLKGRERGFVFMSVVDEDDDE
jgi:hypothetical protein